MSIVRLDGPLLEELRAERLTYGEVGQSLRDDLPAGYKWVRTSEVLGSGQMCFEAAARKVMTWEMHSGAGLDVAASSARAEVDAVAVVRLSIGPIGVSAPCRVVRVVDEPNAQGFAYGTLAGHPESGEESFVVTMSEDGEVMATIVAFSRPATNLARLSGPIGRFVQSRTTAAYLRALSS